MRMQRARAWVGSSGEVGLGMVGMFVYNQSGQGVEDLAFLQDEDIYKRVTKSPHTDHAVT